MLRLVVVSVALIALGARDAYPCSISVEPSANVYGPTDRVERGRRPWIRLWNVKGTITLGLAPPCGPRKQCDSNAKSVAFERVGAFLRPTEPLAAGSRIWIQAGSKTLETFTVKSTEVATLPAWSGMTKPIATTGREGLCAPSGPVVMTKVLPTKADLSDAVLLVYTKQPDAKRPLVNLGAIYLLGVGELELRNGLGNLWLGKQRPSKLWTAISDGDGNIGPIVEHSFDMRAEVFGPKASTEPRGTRPWIRLHGAKTATIQTVDASCDPSSVCTPTMSSAIERGGDFIRPVNPLPAGARVQVVSGKSVLADFAVRTGPGKTLPTIPFTLGSPAGTGEGTCPTPNMVAPDLSTIDTDATVILLYTSPPNPAKPLAKLAAVLKFDGRWLDFGHFGKCLFQKLPPKLWTILATDDGVIGTPVEHDLSPPRGGRP